MSFGNVNDCLNVILFYFNISIDLCSKYRVKSFFNLEPELCIAYRMPYISVVNLLYKIILFIFCYLPLSLLAQDDLPIELINQIESYLEDSDDVEINIDLEDSTNSIRTISNLERSVNIDINKPDPDML